MDTFLQGRFISAARQLLQRTTLLLLLVTTAFNLHAQIPSGYYDNAEGKTGTALRAALHNIIKGHTVVSYDGLKTAYFYTDADSNGKLWDIYSNYRWTSGQTCGNYSGEGDCWNREHTWPSSWFNDKSGPKSDLFHVMPTDGYVNNRRSNYPYGEVGKATYTSKNGSKLGTCSTSGYSGTVFEPIDEYKGDVARNYFYMSTRYYTEDSNWGSSGMTNKSEIFDWAITMLLRWHEQDPVSQKEIDRNNAVYGYQGNRNPFIDHPEYARMIWDENWTPNPTYNITSATNLSGGSVSAPYSAIEGSTVAITATPNPSYAISGYSAWKTGDTSTPVTVSSNGTFTMPAYPVTVSATFVRDNTQYAITLASVENGSISTSATTALSGTSITLSTTPDDGYSLGAIYVYKTGDINTQVAISNNHFTMPSYNVTVSATFVQGSASGTGDFVKVTSAPDDWSGEYLIVCEDYNVAFNGQLGKDWGLCSNVTISNNTIEANATTSSYAVIISKSGNGYQFLFPDGNYMSWTGEKKFAEGTDPASYTISLSSGNANISNGNYTLKYNHNNGNGGLRSYTSGQTSIQLYKLEGEAAPTVTHTVTFRNNDGQTKTQTVTEYIRTQLEANTFTLDGYEFDGWQDSDGNYYADEAYVTLLADLDLYALWDKLYIINCATALTGGTISASISEATEETLVELTASPTVGYQFVSWTVTDADGNDVSVYDNFFTMPACNVSVSAKFRYVGQQSSYYQLVTSASQLKAGQTYLIVYTDGAKALSTTQNTNNRAATAVSINDDNTITVIGSTVCELTLGGNSGAWTLYDAINNGYLCAASNSKNYLHTQSTNDANGQWAITIADDGTASITAQGTYTHNQLKYNNNSSSGNLFSCYESGQKAVSLFVRIDPTYIPGDVNNDGFVTIADITALVNIILGKDDEASTQYNYDAADVNGDGNTTIADVTALVNILLGKDE